MPLKKLIWGDQPPPRHAALRVMVAVLIAVAISLILLRVLEHL